MSALGVLRSRRDLTVEGALAAGRLACWDWEVGRGLVFVDPIAASFMGLSPSDAARGIDLALIIARIHAEDRVRVLTSVQHAVRTANLIVSRFRVVVPDVPERWLFVHAQCCGAGQATARYSGVALDVSAEAYARQAYQPLDALADHLLSARLEATNHDDNLLRSLIDMALLQLLETSRTKTDEGGV